MMSGPEVMLVTHPVLQEHPLGPDNPSCSPEGALSSTWRGPETAPQRPAPDLLLCPTPALPSITLAVHGQVPALKASFLAPVPGQRWAPWDLQSIGIWAPLSPPEPNQDRGLGRDSLSQHHL